MTLEKLDNLVSINQLKIEPPDQNEFDGMLESAKRRLKDAQMSSELLISDYALVSSPSENAAIVTLQLDNITII